MRGCITNHIVLESMRPTTHWQESRGDFGVNEISRGTMTFCDGAGSHVSYSDGTSEWETSRGLGNGTLPPYRGLDHTHLEKQLSSCHAKPGL